jgi:NAD(P)-dependent dehydrogenase (short-subunit alcohol dehydrogenase family)
MTKQLAVELAPLGIRVNTFAPGPTNVERNLLDDPAYRTTWGKMTPMGRTAGKSSMPLPRRSTTPVDLVGEGMARMPKGHQPGFLTMVEGATPTL